MLKIAHFMRALSQLKKIKYSCHAHNRAPTVSASSVKLQETKKAMMVETGRTGRRTKGDTTMKLCSTEPGMMEDEETSLLVLHISNTARLLHLRTESLTAVQHPMSVIHAPVSYVSVVRAWYDGVKQSTETFRTRCGGRDKVQLHYPPSKNKHQKTITSAPKGALFEASGQPHFVEKEKQGEELRREKGRMKKGNK